MRKDQNALPSMAYGSRLSGPTEQIEERTRSLPGSADAVRSARSTPTRRPGPPHRRPATTASNTVLVRVKYNAVRQGLRFVKASEMRSARQSNARLYIMTRRSVQYSPLPTEDRDRGNVNKANDIDLRYIYTPKSQRKIPWKSIALALFLLLIGISLLSLSYFIFSNHMEGDDSQAYGLLFLGYYETRVAYYSWRGAPGYTFASIPDY